MKIVVAVKDWPWTVALIATIFVVIVVAVIVAVLFRFAIVDRISSANGICTTTCRNLHGLLVICVGSHTLSAKRSFTQ